jgi:hypothetical protein
MLEQCRSECAAINFIEGAGSAMMVISETEITRFARLMIKHYGDDADMIAAGRTATLLERGDLELRRVWMRIFVAIREIHRAPSPVEQRIH